MTLYEASNQTFPNKECVNSIKLNSISLIKAILANYDKMKKWISSVERPEEKISYDGILVFKIMSQVYAKGF